MAVLEDVPGVKVTVCINGTDCLEYDEPDIPEQQPNCPTSSKYIESHDDTEFTIRVIIDKDYNWVENSTKERLDKDLELAKTLGSIEVEVRRIITTGGYLADTHTHNPPSSSFELAEKALKGYLLVQQFNALLMRAPNLSPAKMDPLPPSNSSTDQEGKKELVKEESKSIKREMDEVIDLTKSEISTRPTKIRQRLSEIIDLTDD
ncbi:hypothetical protein Daesc_003555 [Daldinia eschscholtzii]|uniref:DUF7918 domain-containing protein n=1 Tax=Daldinia eschscholtzii TaxID=292717 RepID=A0AAX6MTE0_9PEZI